MTAHEARSVLSEGQYDDDAASVEVDLVPHQDDRRVLDEAEEQGLLGKPKRLDGIRDKLGKNGSRSHRRGRLLKEQAEGSANSELMYEMEGGYKDTSSRSSSESATMDQDKRKSSPPRRTSFVRIFLTATAILLAFAALAYGAFKASHKHPIARPLSNGTHVFAPTTILISLDGFRADFLQRNLTPALGAFIASGVSPKYMLPSFPSLTFPNHFTLVTGLYPESHGIVSNQFWDPLLREEFYYTNISSSMQPKWWNAEPLWVTAERAGLKTAIHMWPGSEAHIGDMDPTYLDKFNGTEALGVKVDRVLELVDLPLEERPQLIGAYVPNVDSDGHKYGPNSTQIRTTIAEVDAMLAVIMDGLYRRNLTEVVNVVIVSDHGMATTSNDRLLQLDDYIDMSLVDHIDGWPLRGLRLNNPDRDVDTMHQQLLAGSKSGAFDVYTPSTMPSRYHFSNNDRIAELWVVPKAGWVVIEKADFNIQAAKEKGTVYSPMGLHGYDHEHPLMRAIFVARGPAFPHRPNSRIPVFQNIEVYNIVCDSLGIEPHHNNGTLRLPLKTEGLHSDFNDIEEPPADPEDLSPSGTSPSPMQQTSPDVISGTNHGVESPKTSSSWWRYLHEQIDKVKDWAKQMVDSIKNIPKTNKPSPT